MAACLLAWLSASAAPVHAHVGHVILSAERYLKLDVAGNEARIVVSLTLGAAEGMRVLEAADADEDGRVDDAERDAYLAQWAEGLRDEVPVFVDGERAALGWTDGYFDPVGRVRRAPVTLEMVAHLSLDGGEQTVRFEDRMVRREVFERTDVAFRARDGAELIASGDEAEPTAPSPDLVYPGDLHPGQPIRLSAVLRTPERDDRGPRLEALPWPVILGAAALLLAAGAALVLRARRRE